MDLEKQVAPLIKNDFVNQNITRLRSWFQTFPNAADMLEKELGSPVIVYAIREVKWLSLVFILSILTAIYVGMQYILLIPLAFLSQLIQTKRALPTI